jgi:hypothetical protein
MRRKTPGPKPDGGEFARASICSQRMCLFEILANKICQPARKGKGGMRGAVQLEVQGPLDEDWYGISKRIE